MMAFQCVEGFDVTQICPILLDTIPVAITIIDPEGHILFYNDHSTKILDRKPEYLGRDIRLCHEKPESTAEIDRMLAEFKQGRRTAFRFETAPYGTTNIVTFVPLVVEDQLIGYIQSVIVKA